MTESEAIQKYFSANPAAKRVFEVMLRWDQKKSPKENAVDLGISHQTAINMANRFDLYQTNKKILTRRFTDSVG